MLDAASYTRVFKKAKRSRDRLFIVLARPNERSVARIGFAVAKKHCKSAVDRNRIKRVARESFRHHHATLPGVDIVLLNQPATHRASNRQLFDSLAAHWATIGGRNRANQEQR